MMKVLQRRFVWFGFVVAAFVTAGCEQPSGSNSSDMNALAAQLEQSKKAEADAAAAQQAAAQQAAEEAAAQEEAQRQAAAAQSAESNDDQASGRTTAGAATVGEGGGYMSAIVAAHRHITTRVDDLAWTQAVRHFWAENGRYPNSHEEFMQLMEAQGIPLPELEQGQELLYVPDEGEFGTLYIVEPDPNAPQQTPPPAE